MPSTKRLSRPSLTLNHFFDSRPRADDACEPVAHPLEALSRAPRICPVRPPNPTGNLVQYFVFNEFEQRFSTSTPFVDQFVSVLSAIDVPIPDRSIFSAGVAGTLGGQTLITNPGGGGIMAVAVEGHVDLTAGDRVSTAAFNVHTEGERTESDVMTFPL